MQVVHYTPTKEELLPAREMPCTYPNCGASFNNIGNLNMHIKRHHGNQPLKPQDPGVKARVFHCPHQECIYNEMHAEKRYFKSMKYLKQHYHKVHVFKTMVCNQCGKGFINDRQLSMHMEKMCGVKYICKVCGWTYNALEALLTHGKRKGHEVRDAAVSAPKKQMQRKKRARYTPILRNDQQTQTEVLTESLHDKEQFINKQIPIDVLETCNQETQTKEMPYISKNIITPQTVSMEPEVMHGRHASTNTQLPMDILEPRHIETQTDDEMIKLLRHTTFNSTTVPAMQTLQSSQLLPPSIHTYTQTYDDLFPDSLLGLTDIQTQTNWSSFSDTVTPTTEETNINHYSTSVAGTCTRCTYDELLVSTETQTSFTQCLLDSCQTNTDTEDGSFSNLYQTQHTQTCDMLLGALFGAQQSDLIAGFQSTHTQT